MKNLIFSLVGLLSAIIVTVFLYCQNRKSQKLTNAKFSLFACIFAATNTLLWFLCSDMDNSLLFIAFSAVSLTVLLLIAAYDAMCKFILRPMTVTFSALCLGLVVSDSFLPWYSHILGGALAFVIYFLIRFVASRVEKQEALGMADVILAASMGLALGVWKMLLASVIASFTGLIIVFVGRIVSKYNKKHEYAYSPMLAVGFIISLIFGDGIIAWYLSLLKI